MHVFGAFVFLTFHTLVASQDVIWIRDMDKFEINEGTDGSVYTLLANYQGRSDNIIYGFNAKTGDDVSLSVDNDYFQINEQTGEVFVKSKLDYEAASQKQGIKMRMVAKVRGDDTKYSRQESTVIVVNINDEKPVFINGSLSVTLRENEVITDPNGRLLIENLIVRDVDNLMTPPRRYPEAIVIGCSSNVGDTDCTDTFKLKQHGNTVSTGQAAFDLFVYKAVNFEDSDKFQVSMVAMDGKNNGTLSVVVEVLDIQDIPPIWVELPQRITITDRYNKSQLNARILARDQDISTEGGLRSIEYKFLPGQIVGGIAVESVFKIMQTFSLEPAFIQNDIEIDLENPTFRDFNTGEVRNEWPLEIEACEIISSGPPLVVGTTRTECTDIGTVTILIVDVNDNGPKFENPSYVYTISEDAPNGKALDIPRMVISDKDTERFAIFTSHFVSPSAEFDLIGINTSSPIIIVKNTSLIDYEIGPQRYDLQIKTYDIQNPALFMIVPVTIHILDVNDNYPTFDRLNYTETIPENSQEGTNVVRIQARDIDSLQLGTAGLRYYLRESPYSPLFDIDEITGQLIVAKCTAGKHGQYPCLDYDIPPRTYTLSVSAVDSLGLGWSKAIDVFVRVTDVNDNPPTVIDYTRSIFENSVRFDPPLEVQGNDIDTNSRLSYSIQTQAPNSFWAIDPNTGEIFVNKPNGAGIKFDDGQTGLGRFLLDVAVTDGIYTVISKVTILVIDINDNGPVFQPSLYEISIIETTPPGLSILQLLATDKDDPSSENGILEYKISTGSLGQFRVDINTGKLYTTDTAVLDYDNNNRYEMQVRVSDKGKPRLTALATVIVNILNVNNKDPYIDPFLQNFVVYDNAFIGQKIGTIRAYDQDADAQFNFTFNDQKEATSDQGYVVDYNVYDFRNLFIIDQKNGSILVNGKLNSRITNIVTYGVTVQDVTPKPPQTGLGQAFIRIKPFNTQPPEFENFTSPIYIDEEQPIGSVIVSLIARDNNGIEEFKIIEQPDDFFTVNPNTGAVSVISRVDYDDVRMINDSYLIVQVLDTGEPKLSATASLSVIFRNINDNFPNFLRRSTNTPVNVYNAEIFENAAFNTTVTTVYAEDRDRPDANGYHTVRYFMNDDRFSVDQFTGRIYVNLTNGAVLDRELNPLIRTQVIARDNPQNNPLGLPGNQRQRAAIVSVRLRDENDNPPVFSSASYSVQIFETIGVETDILQLFSTDADIGNYSISFYSKVPGVGTDYNDYFDVRRESGRIYVKRSLLRHVGFYEFLVQATDDLGRGFKANATIYVEVKPSANSPPIWIIPPVDNMTIYVLEEQYNGMLIYDVLARDEDTGNNGIVDYSFIYNGETVQETPEFKINRVTGVISANITYDRERVPRYVLLLKASDRGETPLETTRFLTVIIKDVNDNKPLFIKDEEEFRVQESANVGYPIGQVQAFDDDENPEIFYDIISGNEEGKFFLGRRNGSLSLSAKLDRESKSIYYLDIQASNDEADYTVIRYRRNIDKSIITVKILVGDINDLAPTFLQDQYYGCVSTRAPLNKQIMTVQAIDRDAVGSGVVRYRLVGSNHIANINGQDKFLFYIHPKFGIMTNKVLMNQYAGQTFEVQVNARDGESIEESEDANTTALVFVTQPANEVKLLIGQNTGEVRLYQTQIQSILEEASDLSYVCINEIRDHVVDSSGVVSTLWSDVYVSGIRYDPLTKRYTILSTTEFSNIIQRERTSRSSDFDLLYIKEVAEFSSSQEIELEDSAVLIIMIIIAVLIFLIIVFCIVAFLCIRASKRQKKAMLLHKTHATPAPIPVVMAAVEPEPVIYDNRGFSQEEPVFVQQVEEKRVIETDPVHVQYAVVSKRSSSPERMEYDDDTDAIVTEIRDDDVPAQSAVYEPEYRIETEVVSEKF
ncbi:cadherin-87A-like isoform X2 [Mya arenaria]|uniref:cadherin-87A-like isoform X2 n=1 Tax=Mya arenaria TaxID=6604 RepID=UPI0022DF3A56|nr:cadherin-87A-like isoform X2 [Mya arenaria]